MVGAESDIKWSLQVDHHLMRNDLYLYYFCPKDWRIEEPITFTVNLKDKVLVPDATFTLEGKYYFAEVDRIQKMVENKEKIQAYSLLQSKMEIKFGHAPTLIFYTVSELRKQKLREYCKELGVNARIYTKEDLH